MFCMAALSGEAITVSSGNAGLIPSDTDGEAATTVGGEAAATGWEWGELFPWSGRLTREGSVSTISSGSSHTSHPNLQDLVLS